LLILFIVSYHRPENVLVEKLTVVHLVKKFTPFYRTRSFVTEVREQAKEVTKARKHLLPAKIFIRCEKGCDVAEKVSCNIRLLNTDARVQFQGSQCELCCEWGTSVLPWQSFHQCSIFTCLHPH
jgi:hypothetical protein